WQNIRDNPTGEIKYGKLLKTIDAAHYFLRKSFADAKKPKATETYHELVERLKSATITTVDKDGLPLTIKVIDLIDISGDSPELQKGRILDLTRHPSAGNGGIQVIIYDTVQATPASPKEI